MSHKREDEQLQEFEERVRLNYSSSPISSTYGEKKELCGKSFRLARCCILGIILPIICVSIPLHAKYATYYESEIPLAASDMRIMDKHISTAWCQKQVLEVNASSYSAYLIDSKPEREVDMHQVSMLRHFTITDDTKEYWGFYLLKGSKITVSSCSGRYGTTLLVIRGRQNLQYCAYVGEESTEDNDSSEEAVAVREARKFSPRLNVTVQSEELSEQNGSRADSQSSTINTFGIVKEALLSEVNNIYKKVQSKDHESGANSKLWYSLNGENHREKRRVLERTIDIPRLEDSSEEGTEAFLENSGEFEDPNEFSKKWRERHDGMAQDHGGINFTRNLDSNSEEGSSFSSSEEAMLKCSGFVEYMLLNSDPKCMEPIEPTSNTVSFTVQEDDYYYFIFSSDNERYDAPMSARFTIDRIVYKVTAPIETCVNSTKCEFSLSFGSSQRVLLSLNTPETDSSVWDEIYTVKSICEPRVSMYMGFVLTAIILLMFFAFA
ncbi:uncharacterized protein LOC136029859 isoform X2 [Artemia franciscana]